MANVFDVAKYILDSIGGEISTMKLQKLCYYSQAWFLVWNGVPLFQEEFRRWDNGPVCVELFEKHKGMFLVSSELITTDLLSEELTDIQRSTVDQVIEDYGQYTGAQLSELTHSEMPWTNTERNEIISTEVIRDFYSNLS